MKDFFLKIIYKVLAHKARRVIMHFDPFVVAITGSVGKTSVKEAVFAVLEDEFGQDVRKNEGNLNAEIGLPLTVLGYKKLPNKFLWPFFLLAVLLRGLPKTYPKYLVLEMGVEHVGDIKYLCSIARPNVAIITSVTSAHLVNFSSEEQYQKEKLSIINEIKAGGKIIVNADDSKLKKLNDDNIVSVSTTLKEAEYSASDIKISLEGTEYRIIKSGYKVSIKTLLLGWQMIYPFLFAFALADILELPLIKSTKALEKIKPIPGRMHLIEGKNNTKIIDDTYNANPSSMKAALDFLEEVKYEGKKIAILGNMNELGKIEKEEHLKIANYAKGKADFIIFVGKNSEEMFKSYNNEEKSLAFKKRSELITSIDAIVKGGELVLIKASQNNNYFEEVVKILMKNPEKAKDLLVRQGASWLLKKQER